MNELFKRKSVMVISVFTLLIVVVSLFIYQVNLVDNLSDANCKTLNDVMEQQSIALTTKLVEQKNTIKTFANFFANEDLDEAGLIKELNEILENSTFTYLTIATPDGQAIENTGAHLNISDRDYFKQSLSGKTVISNPIMSKSTRRNIIVFSTPIYKQDEVVAIIIGIYDVEELSALLPPSFNGAGYTHIATSAGDVVANTQVDNPLTRYNNLFNALAGVKVYKHDGFNHIKENFVSGESGHSHYYFEGQKLLMHYAPMNINDWYIVTIAPESVISAQAGSTMISTTILTLIICIVFVFLLMCFYKAHKTHIRELSTIAYFDSLTGLYNKKKFNLVCTELLKSSNAKYAFVMMDVDKFTMLNDTLGYACGDNLLIAIANVLRKNVNADEAFGRDEADRFIMLLLYTDDDVITERVNSIIAGINTEFDKLIGDNDYRLLLSVGINVIADTTEPVTLIGDHAKHALQRIKENHSSTIVFYSEDMRQKVFREKDIENRMQKALKNEEFLLYLQPKYRISTGEMYGAEALVRWQFSSDTLVYPGEFIPLFEKNGFVTKLDMYMLEKTCAFLRNQIDTGINPITISINFSRRHLENPNFVDEIAEIVERYKISPRLIELELTESTMHENEDVLIDVLDHIHEHGFTLSMDDFGSGYSSLGLLKNLSVDAIKLDGTFFTQYTDLKRAKAVISNVITMTKELEIYTVAEGVESQESVDLLRELGCDIVQGFYFAKPMEASCLNKLLTE